MQYWDLIGHESFDQLIAHFDLLVKQGPRSTTQKITAASTCIKDREKRKNQKCSL